MGPKSRRQDHYEVLGVNADAPDEVIRAAYRALAAKYHPDKNPGDSGAEVKVKRLNAAFHVLSDSARRRHYDELTAPIADHHDPPPGVTPPRPVAPSEGLSSRAPGARSVFRKVLRFFMWGAGASACAIVALVVYLLREDARERAEYAKDQAEQALVSVEADYDPDGCNTEHPIRVAVSNASARTVKSVSFDFQLFEVGRSDDLTGYDGHREATSIVQPGATAKTCYRWPKTVRTPTAKVLIRADKKGVTFYREGEFIPGAGQP
jgi:curved DNA-binding protein CbpA